MKVYFGIDNERYGKYKEALENYVKTNNWYEIRYEPNEIINFVCVSYNLEILNYLEIVSNCNYKCERNTFYSHAKELLKHYGKDYNLTFEEIDGDNGHLDLIVRSSKEEIKDEELKDYIKRVLKLAAKDMETIE